MRQHGQMRLLEARRRDPVVLVVGIPASTTGFSADAVPKVGDASHDGLWVSPVIMMMHHPRRVAGIRACHALASSSARRGTGSRTWPGRGGGPSPDHRAGP